MGLDQVQTLEAQHPISLRYAFQKATFRVVYTDIARISGCGSSQRPVLAIGRPANIEACCVKRVRPSCRPRDALRIGISREFSCSADSDDFAQAFRFQIARDSDLISPTVPI